MHTDYVVRLIQNSAAPAFVKENTLSPGSRLELIEGRHSKRVTKMYVVRSDAGPAAAGPRFALVGRDEPVGMSPELRVNRVAVVMNRADERTLRANLITDDAQLRKMFEFTDEELANPENIALVIPAGNKEPRATKAKGGKAARNEDAGAGEKSPRRGSARAKVVEQPAAPRRRQGVKTHVPPAAAPAPAQTRSTKRRGQEDVSVPSYYTELKAMGDAKQAMIFREFLGILTELGNDLMTTWAHRARKGSKLDDMRIDRTPPAVEVDVKVRSTHDLLPFGMAENGILQHAGMVRLEPIVFTFKVEGSEKTFVLDLDDVKRHAAEAGRR